MDNLISMKVFRHVVESGSFVGAANRLGVSTVMVSKYVMALEKRLLNRNSHRLSLTEPGQLYFERCKSRVAEEVLQNRDERALPSVDPYRTRRGELGVVLPVVRGAH